MPYIGNKAERQKGLRRERKSRGLCINCCKPNPTKFYRCPECKKIHNEKKQLIRRNRIASDLCYQCGKNPIDSSRSKGRCSRCLDRENKSHFSHRDKRNAHCLDYQRRLKDGALAAYGGPICACCGEENKMLLSIDHMNNDGAQHRREVVKSFYIYSWLKQHNYPSGYQVLCFSCNHGRHLNGGSLCPAHKEHAYIKYMRFLKEREQLVEKTTLEIQAQNALKIMTGITPKADS